MELRSFGILACLAFTAIGVTACGHGATSASASADGGDPASGSASAEPSGGDQLDGGSAVDAAVDHSLTPCPTSGKGGIVPPTGTTCFTLTPAQTGAVGANADVPHYALAPGPTSRDELVVFFNGSLVTPASTIASPNQSFFAVAASLGYHVIGLSYKSDDLVGKLCADDACFFPTRKSVILGAFQPGASPKLATIAPSEGIVPRIQLALRWLSVHDPSGGWSSFLDGADVRWSKITTAGHSQGGGHATAIAKLFPVKRVIQLSSTCDAVGSAPATWTSGTPLSDWKTDPRQFRGLGAPTIFGAGGAATGVDTTCPHHAAVWQNLGMAQPFRHDDAETCGVSGQTHGESIMCPANAPAWKAMLE